MMLFFSHLPQPLAVLTLQFRLNLLFCVVSLAHNKKSHCVSSEKATLVAFSFGCGHSVVTPALVADTSLQANKPSPVGEKQSGGLFSRSSPIQQGRILHHFFVFILNL